MKKIIVPNTRIGHVEINMMMDRFSEFYKQNPHLESRQKQYKFRGKTNTFLEDDKQRALVKDFIRVMDDKSH